MRQKRSIALPVWMSLFSLFAFIAGAEPFDRPGPAPVKAIVAGCIAGAVYLAACQFLAVLRSRDDWRSRCSVFLIILTPILAASLLTLAVEKRQVFLSQGVPILVSGFIGNLAGALIGAAAARMKRKQAARKRAAGTKMPFFVVGDQMGVHVYEYPDVDQIPLGPGEVLVGRAETLEEAQLIQAETDPLSLCPPAES